jgi:hypothetical protein
MYNPPKTGPYCYMFAQVYDQGYELAKQKKAFVNPYETKLRNDIYGVQPISVDLYNWYYRGFYDYPYKDIRYPDQDDMPKLIQPRVKKCKVVLKDGEKAIVEIEKAPTKRKARSKNQKITTIDLTKEVEKDLVII